MPECPHLLQRQSKALTRLRSGTRPPAGLSNSAGTACWFNHYDERCKPRRASPCALQVAGPDLEGRQVTVLRLHAASMPRNAGSILLAKEQVCAPQHKNKHPKVVERRLGEVRGIVLPRTPVNR